MYDNYSQQPSAWETLSGTTKMTATQSAVIQQTYLLLGLAVFSAIAGGFIGATSETVLSFMTSRIGFIVALVALNVVPWVAMSCRHNPVLGVSALVGNGFLAGLVISPLLALAGAVAPQMIVAALAIATAVFAAVTGYVFMSSREFSAPRGLMVGLFVTVTAGVILNMFLHIGWFGVVISIGIGAIGVLGLVYSTSGVLRSRDADSPIPGALALFAGLFNIFVAALNLLLRLTSLGRRD